MKQPKAQLILFFTVLGIFAVAMYVMNIFYPLFGDDWVYTFVHGENPVHRISSIQDLLYSQINHYQTWGGRTVAHTIAQLLLCFSPWLYNILNTGVLILFVYIMYRMVNEGKQTNGFTLLFIIVLLLLFTQPLFIESAIWITGSANYLWTSLLILLFIYPYYLFYKKGENNNQNYKLMLMPILGILAGWTNENSALALIFIILAFLFLMKYEKQKIPFWAITGLIGTIAGCVFLITAPGNFLRMELEMELLNEENRSLLSAPLSVWIARIGNVLRTMIITRTLFLVVIYGIVFFIYNYLNKTNGQDNEVRKTVCFSFILFLAALIATFAMMGAPIISYRTLFFSNCLLIMGIVMLCSNINVQNIWCQLGSSLLILLICIVPVSYDYYKKMKTIHFLSQVWEERAIYIENEKNKGNFDIALPTRFTVHPKFLIHELKEYSDDHKNTYYAHYMGVRTVVIAPDAKILTTP